MLKEGSDHFEVTNKQPKVDVCEKRYVFNRVADEGGKFNSRLECPASKTSRSLALAFNAKQSKDQAIFDKILKRNAASPFVKPEDKPLTTDLSIKADPTIGALAILEPPKPEPVVAPVKVQEPAVTNVDTPVATQEANPISAEVVQTEVTTTIQSAQSQAIAVPEQAQRIVAE